MAQDSIAQPPSGPVNLVLASVALLLLLAALDQTIVSTALPTIVADLGGLEHLSWVVTSYVLASTVVAPLYGKLGDLYGRRVMIFVSVGLFLAGSALCGLSRDMTQLILARAVQGLGGGGLFVLAFSVVGDVIPPKDRGKIQGLFAAVFSTSSVAGPLMGGWFVEVFSWHWIFFINLPLGAVALVVFAASFKAHPARVEHAVDWAGAALLSISLAALTLATSLGGQSWAWSSPQILGLFALTLIAGALFIAVERRAKEPILPLDLFRLNAFWVTNLVGFGVGISMFGAITFVPIYLQIATGASPMNSGLLMIPMTAGILIASTFAGKYMSATGRYRMLPILGLVLQIVGLIALAQLDGAASRVIFGAAIVIFGLGMGCIFPVLTTAVQNAVPRQQIGTATAAGLLFRQVGGSLGVAAFGALFAVRLAGELTGMGALADEAMSLSPRDLASLPETAQAALSGAVVAAIRPIYYLSAAFALGALVVAFLLEEVPLATTLAPPRGE